MGIRFCKFHGFGNDYIVVEKAELRTVPDISEFTKKICRRNSGVGSDGVAVLERLDGGEADYSCRIVNPDGSEAGFSGNGTRCAVGYLYFKNLWTNDNLRLKTKSGIKNYEFLKRDEDTFWYMAELGKPHFAAGRIPFKSDRPDSRIENYELQISDRMLPVTALNVGNPVCVIFVEDFDFDWRKIGSEIEIHPQFPERTNVVFVRVTDQHRIEIRIWERGAGETSSSGTCSIAAAVSSAATGKTARTVAVHAVGGVTEAVWRDDDEMLIMGSAELAFCGEWFGT